MPNVVSDPAKQLLAGTSLLAFTKQHDVQHGFLKPANLVTISKDASVGDAMQLLAENKILSAPVLDSTTKEYVGTLDVLDLVKGLVRGLYPELLDTEWVESHVQDALDELETSIGPIFTEKKVATMVHEASLWSTADPTATLLDVVVHAILTEGKDHKVHHRVAIATAARSRSNSVGHITVFNDAPGHDAATEWRVADVISQSDIVRWLWANRAQLGPVVTTPVSELGLLKPVKTIPADATALAAFVAMVRDNVSSVGITEGVDGPLLANLSVSDLRCLTKYDFGLLARPVAEFVAIRSGTAGVSIDDAVVDEKRVPGAVQGRWAEVLEKVPAVSVAPEDTFGAALDLLETKGLHRVYIVDRLRKPVGIITLTDVLRLLTAP